MVSAFILDDCVAPAGRMFQMRISCDVRSELVWSGPWLASVFCPKRGRWFAALYALERGPIPILDATISFHDRWVGEARKFNGFTARQAFDVAESINCAIDALPPGPFSI